MSISHGNTSSTGNYNDIGVASVLTPHSYDVYGVVSHFTQINVASPWRHPTENTQPLTFLRIADQ